MATRAKASKKRNFHDELVLNHWMLRFFNVLKFDELKDRLADDRFEGLDDDGQTKFFGELIRGLFNPTLIPEPDLRRYDLHIVAHWRAITTERNKQEGHTLQLKYFQYLSLLFTEIYLDWYFNRKQELLDGLNDELAGYRAAAGAQAFRDYLAGDLAKLAFWNATGSGKTLLMHVNLLQYLQYFSGGRAGVFPDKIILLTPNEGLSRQHLGEFALSRLPAQLFDKGQTMRFRGTVEVIDVNKLADTMGDKTVAVEAFEGDNLVLVDEGHRGTGTAAGAWMRRRAALVSKGFAFEYSATFGQSVAKGMTISDAEEDIQKKRAKILFGTTSLRKLGADDRAQLTLTDTDRREARTAAVRETYAKCILFDYSYKYFYAGGYGKESLILNMRGEAYRHADNAKKYFVACLLAYYQQLWLWGSHRAELAGFNIEKPLWVFVGNTVAGEDSDILEVMSFLAWFLNNPGQVETWLADLVADRAQILDAKGGNVFKNRFTPLINGPSGAALYADILHRVFNASARQRLKLVNIRNSSGELALRVGEAEPFGLISVGDEAGLFKNAEELDSLDTERDDFGGALFDTINNEGSRLNVLIGSRKFTEGWSSWRVSTMGLLNMGRGEGSQIIQLFGRGVRLKGRNFSLKRSLPHERPRGVHLDKLEALNVFGVRANYMEAFKDYLREEGITPSDEILELDFPTRSTLPSGKLKTLKLKDGYKDNQTQGFKRTHFPWLYEVPAEFAGKIKPPHVTVDLYPRVEALATRRGRGTAVTDADSRHQGKLGRALFPMFDWDRIYLALQAWKLERTWSNLRLDQARLRAFCNGSDDWYTLFVPAAELKVRSFADVNKQEDILIRLLTDYTDRFYQALKTGYEGQFYEVIPLTSDQGSMLKLYQFEIENSADGLSYKQKLEVLKQLVADGDIGQASQWNAPHVVAISFDRHLYYPLFGFETEADKQAVPLKLRPLGLGAKSEIDFVCDLENFYHSPTGKEAIGERSLYLLRNAASADKGLGFALASNFYPDFLLWLVDDVTGEQWLTFVDPKGLRNVNVSSPKLALHQEVKKLQKTLASEAAPGSARLVLDSFILSHTKYADLINVDTSQNTLEAKHVLFMGDGGPSYLAKMFQMIDAAP